MSIQPAWNRAVAEIHRVRRPLEIDQRQLIKVSLCEPHCAGPGSAERVECLLILTPAPSNLFPQGLRGCFRSPRQDMMED